MKRGDTTNVVNESQRNKIPKRLLGTEDQASLELLRKEDKDNMAISDADVSSAISIVLVLQLLPALKN